MGRQFYEISLTQLMDNMGFNLMQDDEHARHHESNAAIASEAEHGAGRQHSPQVDAPSTIITIRHQMP